MVAGIIFDCFGVLTTDTWLAFLDSLPEGTDLQAARDLNHAYDAGIITREEFLAKVKEVTSRQPQEVEKLLASEIVKNQPLLDYIRQLKQRGYKIALLSNIATNWIRDSFLTPEEQELFDQMIFSFEVGMTKPDPRIFMLTCERLRIGLHEAVLVDDIERYCDAARQEGMRAIAYKDFKQTKQELETLLAQKP